MRTEWLMVAAVAGVAAVHRPPPRPLDPHMLPQCVKNEPGCEKDQRRGKVGELLDPVHWVLKGIFDVRNWDANFVKIQLFQPDGSGSHCRGEDKNNWYGGEKDHEINLVKNKCKTLKPKPIANMSMNYETPNTKVDNHCDLTFYDGRKCTGDAVYRINGALELDMINGQSYCHVMQWAKSVKMGPCS